MQSCVTLGLEMFNRNLSAGRRRPRGVVLIALVQAFNALSLGGLIVAVESDAGGTNLSFNTDVLGLLWVAVGLATAVGLWQLQRWAWVMTMLWAGLSLAIGLWTYAHNETTSYFTMAVSIVQVFYLNLTEVQEAFEPEWKRDIRHYG